MPFLLLTLLLFSSVPQASLISTSVGRVKDHVVTSREVSMHFFIKHALTLPSEGLQQKRVPPLESTAFSEHVTQLLLEQVVFLESQNFPVAKVSDTEMAAAKVKVNARLKNVAAWTKLQATNAEIDTLLRHLLQSENFIQFKVSSSSVPVTDAEAKDYYEANSLRFGNLPFENFKDNIKSYLTKTQSEKRLKEWYEVLQTKYKVRNFLAEI